MDDVRRERRWLAALVLLMLLPLPFALVAGSDPLVYAVSQAYYAVFFLYLFALGVLRWYRARRGGVDT